MRHHAIVELMGAGVWARDAVALNLQSACPPLLAAACCLLAHSPLWPWDVV